jgi:hypothetical protein
VAVDAQALHCWARGPTCLRGGGEAQRRRYARAAAQARGAVRRRHDRRCSRGERHVCACVCV